MPRLEIDVQFLADDSMAIFHDGAFPTVADIQVKLADLSRQTVRDFTHPGGEPIGFLEDVVAAIAGSNTLLQVDLKLSRPITARRLELFEDALAPLGEQVIVGSQAHWNLRKLSRVPVAFDPTLHWVYSAWPPGIPRSRGVHGFWDDSPMAGNSRFTAAEYLEARVEDLLALVPEAVEWMVDIGTILKLDELGMALGDRLRERGVALAAWTLRAGTDSRTTTLERLFRLGVETVITDVPELAAAAVL